MINWNFNKICFLQLKKAFLLLLLLISGAGGFAQILVPELSFKNPVLESGQAGKDGAIYRFSSVAVGVDALVRINGRSSQKCVLTNIDISNTGSDNAWQPQVNYMDGAGLSQNALSDWYMEFEIHFVHAGTREAVTVNNFDVMAFDNDGNANLQEWLAFYNEPAEAGGVKKVFYSANNMQGEMVLGKRIIAAPKEYPGIDMQAKTAMVHSEYQHSAGFKLRIGARARGPVLIGNGGREYCFLIQSFSFHDPMEQDLPETLLAFNASIQNNKVLLHWITEKDSVTSHFLIQRSLDGQTFSDAAVIFTEEDINGRKEYQFRDPVKENPGKPIFYRLKLVNMENRYAYSEVIEVRSEIMQRVAASNTENANSVEADIDRMASRTK